MTHTELGQHGEELAIAHLRKHDYEILETNFRYNRGEVDVICMQQEILVICEVKTRCTAVIGEPWLAVTRAKQKQIIAVANGYIRQKSLNVDVRFDIVSIVHNQFRSDVTHLENAFFPTL